MLEQESKVKEAEVLNCVESLIKAISSWSNNFIDILDLRKII